MYDELFNNILLPDLVNPNIFTGGFYFLNISLAYMKLPCYSIVGCVHSTHSLFSNCAKGFLANKHIVIRNLNIDCCAGIL